MAIDMPVKGKLLSDQERCAIRQRMRETKLTQEKVADSLGVRQSAVSTWLSGRSGISYSILAELNELLNLHLVLQSVPIDVGLAMALEKGEVPTMKTLDVLANRGYRCTVDPRVPSRDFYRSGEDVRRTYQRLRQVFLSPFSFPDLTPAESSDVRIVETPTPRYFWVSYIRHGENPVEYNGHFDSLERPLNSDARRILTLL